MKIAILLRGQMKNCALGSILLQRTLIERYPEHDFKVFVHTWTTTPKLNKAPMEINSYGYLNEHSYEEIEDLVKLFDPVAYQIDSPHILSNVIKEITDHTHNDTSFIDWWNKHELSMNKSNQTSFMNFLLCPNTNKGNRYRENGYISANYKLGQTYSAGAVHEVYKKYCEQENYKADIVINTRADIAWTTMNEKYDNLISDLKAALDNASMFGCTPDPVIVQGLRGIGPNNWFCDLRFVSTHDTMIKWFGNNTREHFLDLFVNRKHILLPYLTNLLYFGHTFWSYVGHDIQFVSTDKLLPQRFLIRNHDNYSHNDLLNMSTQELIVLIKNELLDKHNSNRERIEDDSFTHKDAVHIVLGKNFTV